MVRVYIAAFLLLGALLLPSPVAAVTIGYSGAANITKPGDFFTGLIQISYDTLLPPDAVLTILVNNAFAKNITLSSLLPPPASYTFAPQIFSYNLSATGLNTWTLSTPVAFTYRLSVNYTCHNTDTCPCPNLPFCTKAPDPPVVGPFSRAVSATDGLKFVNHYANESLPVPAGVTNVIWDVIETSNETVQTTMRAACARQTYWGNIVGVDGFVRRRLLCTSEQCSRCAAAQAQNRPCLGADSGCLGTLCRSSWHQGSGVTFINNTIERFDNLSLSLDRNKFGGGLGGIYKDGVYLPFEHNKLIWNGSSGYIEIYNYDPASVYTINYLPPNGPNLCAKTNFIVPRELAWTRMENQGNSSVTYTAPYSHNYTDNLHTVLRPPDCLPENSTCTKETLAYNAFKTLDPANSVAFSYFPEAKLVNATTTSTRFVQNYTLIIPLRDQGISSAVPGQNSLSFLLFSSQGLLQRFDRAVGVCTDRDQDGACAEENDCNDDRSDVYAGAAEQCDGLDNNCNGQADENYSVPGARIGDACNDWAGSACAGTITCAPDKKSTLCSGKAPKTDPEICGDGIDNDCNGLIDETGDGTQPAIVACRCKDGATQTCGSAVGSCTLGFQVCRNGAWAACLNNIKPAAEICNQKDDNCDGIVDNLGALSGGAGTDTVCGCLNGKLSQLEVCNNMDDDCNGRIDDGIACACTPGESRACGVSDLGSCRKGAQRCQSGDWGTCEGATSPRPEICFNDVDEDCDGTVDEDCGSASIACRNGVQDAFEQGVDCGGPCNPCEETRNAVMLIAIFAGAIGVIFLVYVLYLVHAGKKEGMEWDQVGLGSG